MSWTTKKYLPLIPLILVILVVLFPRSVSASSNLWQFPGMMFRLWDYGNAEHDYAVTCPDCGPAGGIFVKAWSELNPGEGSYNFSAIENYLNQTRNMRTAPFPDGTTIPRPFIIQITISQNKDTPLSRSGDYTPSWVYDHLGVARINDCNGVGLPNYGDPQWKNAYFTFLQALANTYGNNERVAGFIIGDGYEDEAYATKGCSVSPFGNNYHIFLRELVQSVGQSFAGKRPAYIPTGGGGYTNTVVEAAESAAAAGNPVGLKSNTITDSYKNGAQMRWIKIGATDYSFFGQDEYLSKQKAWSAAWLTRDTVSWAFEDAKGFGAGSETDIARNVYYQWLIALSLHPDFMDWRDFPGAARPVSHVYPYFTKIFVPIYLSRTKADTPGAWLAFHSVTNETINGPEIACWNGNTCEDHIPNDLRFYLERVADTGSIPRFRNNLPAAAQGQIFGFGRELLAGGEMSLKVENAVWFKAGARELDLRMILLNSGSGTIEIIFKKNDGSLYTETIAKGSALGALDQFVEVSGHLPAVVFDGSFSDGGDFLVRAKDGKAILHFLEIKPLAGSAALNLSRGWNHFWWENSWLDLFLFRNLPASCSFVAYSENNRWSLVYNSQTSNQAFVSGGEYYLYCSQPTTVNF